MNLQQNYKTHQLYQIYVEIFVNQVIHSATPPPSRSVSPLLFLSFDKCTSKINVIHIEMDGKIHIRKEVICSYMFHLEFRWLEP